MKRREFITLLGGAAAAWPLAARAQQAERMRRIGVLIELRPRTIRKCRRRSRRFRQGLERLGWSEGRNVRIDTRWAHGNPDQTQVLAKELVALQPDVILAHSTPVACRAAAGEPRDPDCVRRTSPTRSARASSRAWRGRAASSRAC